MAKTEKPVMGAPTKYNKSKLKAAIKYIDDYKEKHGHAIPSVAGLAVVLGVCRKTVYSWSESEKNKDFLYTLSRIATNQEFHLLNGGLLGDFNPTITKLALANHGYSDRPAEKEDDDAPSVDIHFHVKDAVSEIKTTNAKS